MKIVEIKEKNKEKRKLNQNVLDFISEMLANQEDIQSVFICYSIKENGDKISKYAAETIDFNECIGMIDNAKLQYQLDKKS